MKKKRIKHLIIGTLILIIGFVVFTDNYYGRLIRWNIPDVYDYEKFPYENIQNSDNPYLRIPMILDTDSGVIWTP